MSIYTTPLLNINLKKIVSNYLVLKKLADNAIAGAVVKNDAYGLGAKRVAQALYKVGCRDFFVAHALEGVEVRSVAKEANIYVLQGIGEDSLKSFIKASLIPVIAGPLMFEFWKNNKINGIKPVIQVETGLNRLGFSESDIEKLSIEEREEFSFVLSHLSCADEKAHFMNARQLENFKRIKEKYFKDTKATLSASDGVFLGGKYLFDMVRLGAGMYGINTAPYRENEMENVLEVKAPVLVVKDLKKGEFVGYSATFRAYRDMRIAVVSIGYADGILRSLSNRGKVVFYDENNKPCFADIIGRISMDNVIVDITDVKNVKEGDFACLISHDYTLDDMARDAGVIAYEVVSYIGGAKRFIRNYIE